MANNKSVIAAGHKKALLMIKRHLIAVGEEFARFALVDAVSAWDADKDSDDLTGNVRTGFCAGVYFDGRLVGRPITVFDTGEGYEYPTHTYTKPGDSGFKEYGSNDYIGREGNPSVRQYSDPDLSFQPIIEGSYGFQITSNWLREYKPSIEGMTVVVANAVSYAPYLKQARSLDILDSVVNGSLVTEKMRQAFHYVHFNSME